MMRADRQRMQTRLAELVGIETPTGHVEGIDRALDVVAAWLPEGRRHVEVGEPGGPSHRSWPASGERGPLLLGHIDTVWPLGTIDRKPFAIDGDVATGPGVFDMKAGIVVMAEALAIARHGDEVAVLLTSDEEVGSITSRAVLEDAARASSHVLVLEPSLAGDVKVARRGGSIYRLTFTGVAAHAGLEPEAGRSALVALAGVVLDVAALADDDAGTSVSPTVASAGTVTNVIPAEAALAVDVRAWSMRELERIDVAMRALAGDRDGVDVIVDGGINRPPMEVAVARDLLALAQGVAATLGQPALHGARVGGASDGNFTAALGVPTLDGLGPKGDGAHAEHEWVSCASMAERAELLADLLDALVER